MRGLPQSGERLIVVDIGVQISTQHCAFATRFPSGVSDPTVVSYASNHYNFLWVSEIRLPGSISIFKAAGALEGENDPSDRKVISPRITRRRKIRRFSFVRRRCQQLQLAVRASNLIKITIILQPQK